MVADYHAVRASKGLILWLCAGVTRDGCYWPAPEGLAWEWWKRGNQLWRPCVWRKNGPPGTGQEQWLRNDWEFVLAFKRVGPLPWADPLACAEPPKRSARLTQGTVGTRRPNGERYDRPRPSHAEDGGRLANPGNVIDCPVYGSSRAGARIGRENEAPYPERLPAFFIRPFAAPSGIVCDPFSGSGTTGAVAVQQGRRFLGCDLRPSQVELSRRRSHFPRGK